MNDGGVEGTREDESELVLTRCGGGNDFGREVAKVAVSRICESVGFHGVKESALDSFTELAITFLCELGKNSSFSANLAGRRECSVFDVIRGLEDLGFSGSVTMKELMEYVRSGEEMEIPYVQPVPHFPMMRNQVMIPSFVQMGETPPGKHIPGWLPAFPDPHTYICTSMWNERETDPRADKIEQTRQRRKAERSLLSLQQRLASNGSVGSSYDKNVESQTTGHSPFPVIPIHLGEENLLVVDLPTKLSDEATGEGHVSVVEAFAPVIEAVEGGVSDDGDGERKFAPNKIRARVTKTARKLMGESLDLNLKNKGERPVTWIARDDERDEKKRRAEYILRQSMENPQDLLQL